MKHSSTFFALVTFLFSSQDALASSISWDVSNAIAQGSTCTTGDDSTPANTFFVVNGSDVSVLMPPVKVALEGAGELAGRASCSVRIPLSIESGYYPSVILQSFTYSVRKSEGSLGSISTRHSVFNAPVSPLTVSFPLGIELERNHRTARHGTVFSEGSHRSLIASWCRSPSGIYKFDMAASGQRQSEADTFVVESEGDILIDLSFGLQPCP